MTDQARGRIGLRGHPWYTLATVSVGAMMVALDSTVVMVAQPTLQARLGANIGEVQWVTAGYLLPLAALLIVAGKVGDRFGHRLVFLVGTVGFALSSVAIALSADIRWVIGLRVAQGVFGALLQPPTLALLRMVFPADRIGLPIALRSAALGIATAAGPVVGGLLVQRFGWQAIFLLNVPIAALVLVSGLLVLREARPGAAARTSDPVAVVLLSASLLALLWGVINAPQHGWGTATWLAIGAATVLAAGFCRWETRVAEPLVPMSLFRSPGFAAGVTLMTLVSFALFGIPFALTFFLQNTLHLSTVDCGVQVLRLTLAMVVAGVGTGMVIRRTGVRVPAVLGIATTAVAAFGLAHTIGDTTDVAGLQVWLVLLGLSFSTVIVTATHLIVNGAPLRYSGVASGLQQTAMQIGGSLGTTVVGTVVAARVGALLPGELADAGVHLNGQQLADAVRSAAVGVTPRIIERFPWLVRATFVDGVASATLVCAGLATVGTIVAVVLLTRPTRAAEPVDTPEPERRTTADIGE